MADKFAYPVQALQSTYGAESLLGLANTQSDTVLRCEDVYMADSHSYLSRVANIIPDWNNEL
jgi:hypothetical protein